jgi:hypothetical protein
VRALLIVVLAAGTAHADDIDFEADPRPIVMPAGAVDAHGAVPFVAVPQRDSIVFASAGFNYGIVDRLELGGDLLVKLHNGNQKFAVTPHVAFAAYHDGPLEIAAAVGVGLALIAKPDGTGDTDVAVLGGAWVRYHVSQRLAVFTGQPAVPIAGTTGDLPPFTYQLSIGVDNAQPVKLVLPAGVSYQIGTQVYLFAALQLATIFFTNGPGTLQLVAADYLPVGGGAMVSPNDDVDVGLEIADDLEGASDKFSLQVFARLYVR